MAASTEAATRPAVKILLIAILMTTFLTVRVDSTADFISEDAACNCDHCEVDRVQPVNGIENSSVVPSFNKEDADGDGNFLICARDRDLYDKSFPTVCHMLCHNRCTRYNQKVIHEGNYNRYIATAYRTNYYKLHDGPCKKV